MSKVSVVRKLRWAALIALLSVCWLLVRKRQPAVLAEPLLLDDPATLALLDKDRLSFDRVVGRDRLEVIARVVAEDVAEFARGLAPNSPRRSFKPEWLARGRFELVGIVNRVDRRRFDPAACGEVRLVYRLAIDNPSRPSTRLPMTLNVRVPQPRPAEDADCSAVASRWLAKGELLPLLDELPAPAQIEINYQSIHTPSYREDMDDTAEYVLRSFSVHGRALREDVLFNTPRADASPVALRAWVAAHLREIDDGSAVLPNELLARRVISVSPRGLAREENRPFSRLVVPADLAELPLSDLTLARTPELLLRRLDEATCAGCHQTRGVAGFHLLGEERDDGTFNRLAVGHSAHFTEDLAWRMTDLTSLARKEPNLVRPFAAYPTGEPGSACGLIPGFSSWSCREGLTCRDVHHAAVGVCSEPSVRMGAPCEDVSLSASTRAEGPVVSVTHADVACPPAGRKRRADARGPFCAPNWLGFTGGTCTRSCETIGHVTEGTICAPVPAAGYEADCFFSDEAIEQCLPRHVVESQLMSCDAARPCRDDYGCARVPDAPRNVGACVPPYFIFQARIDGPRLDR